MRGETGVCHVSSLTSFPYERRPRIHDGFAHVCLFFMFPCESRAYGIGKPALCVCSASAVRKDRDWVRAAERLSRV